MHLVFFAESLLCTVQTLHAVEKPHPYWFYIYGFNVAIVGGLFATLFLRLLGAQRRFLAAGLSAAVIAFYAVMVGAEPSVVRAAIIAK